MSIATVNANLVREELQTNKNNVPPLDNDTAKKVFALYQRFIDINNNPESEQMRKEFTSPDSCPFPWEDLHVEISTEEMEEILDRTGILQLRATPQDCRILVVGCGNEPTADAGGSPLASKSRDGQDVQYYLNSPQESESYRKTHAHPNALTINPYLAFNPTLVSFFGTQHYPMLKTGQFDLIVIEGTMIEDTTIGREELNRLLSASGRVVVNQGDEKGLQFSWEDNSKSCWEADYVSPPVVIEDLNVYESFSYQK
jgi:hypothetical protein